MKGQGAIGGMVTQCHQVLFWGGRQIQIIFSSVSRYLTTQSLSTSLISYTSSNDSRSAILIGIFVFSIPQPAEIKGESIVTEQIDRLLTQQQAVEWTGMSPAWFEMARFKGTGIPYVKMGRAVRYREKDITKFINDHMIGTGI
jgi:hypothetical protein